MNGLGGGEEPAELGELARRLGDSARRCGATIVTAESCTGGLIGRLLTDVPGSSDYYLGGAIAYANSAKRTLLGVAEATLHTAGAVSEETAREMAEGARRRLAADIAVGVTGIAGPGGGSPAKPVGLVYIAVAAEQGTSVECHNFAGSRADVRSSAAASALRAVLATLERRPIS